MAIYRMSKPGIKEAPFSIMRVQAKSRHLLLSRVKPEICLDQLTVEQIEELDRIDKVEMEALRDRSSILYPDIQADYELAIYKQFDEARVKIIGAKPPLSKSLLMLRRLAVLSVIIVVVMIIAMGIKIPLFMIGIFGYFYLLCRKRT
jgi:hypothetical protein